MPDASSISRRAILLNEMATIQLANEKRVARAQQLVAAAASFDPEAVLAAAKEQVAAQLKQAEAEAASAAADAATLSDLNGRYKKLFDDIDSHATDNPGDLVAQYQKALKDGFVQQAEDHKAEIEAASIAVADKVTAFKV